MNFSGNNALGSMAAHLLQMAAGGYRHALTPVLDEVGKAVKDEVKKEIGTYQPGVGQYPATAPLAQSTLETKAKKGHGKGGNPDTPLWATGDFHDDVNFKSNTATLSVQIGTNKEYIAQHELGNVHHPPRPVFGPATLRVLPHQMPLLAKAAAMGIAGGAWKGLGAFGRTHTKQGASATLSP